MNYLQSVKLLDSRGKFLPHDAACYWNLIFEEHCPSALYFRDHYEGKGLVLPGELKNMDGEDIAEHREGYARVRGAIHKHGLDEGKEISRNALQHIAATLGEDPLFLRPGKESSSNKKLVPSERKSLLIIINALMRKVGLVPMDHNTTSKVGKWVNKSGYKLDPKTIHKHLEKSSNIHTD